MATLDEIRNAVRWRLGQRDDLASVSSAGGVQLDDWINSAYREICHTFRFHELEQEVTASTSLNSRTAGIPPDTYAVFSVFDTTNNNYLNAFVGEIQEYERRIGTTPGKPDEWLLYGNFLYFRPIPDGAYNLRIMRYHAPLALVTGQTPVIPEVFHDLIKLYATRNGWTALDDLARAAAITQGEITMFLRTIRTPRMIESHNPNRRGLKARLGITNRRLGV